MKFNPTELIVLMFTATVCIMVIMTGLSWAIRGPEAISDAARDYMKDIIFLMVGGVLAFIGISKSNEK